MANPTQVNNLTGPVYTLDSQGNATYAGDLTLGKTSLVQIPQTGTITLYSTDGTSINMVDATGAKTQISAGGGGAGGDFTTLTVSGNGTVGGTLGVTGNTTIGGTLAVTGTISQNNVLLTPTPNDGNPQMSGVNSWNFDPENASSTGLLVSGTVYLHKIILNTAVTATNIVIGVTTQGSVLTAGDNVCGIYSSAGTRLAVTVDQTAAWGSSGGKACALTAPLSLAAGTYYIGILSVGTTPITAAESSGFALAYNNVQTAAAFRHSTNGTGATSLPASITPASNVTSARSTWVGIN